jgi:hypothetical protein
MDVLRIMYFRNMYAVPVKRAVLVAQVISSIGANLVGKRDGRYLSNCQVRLLIEEAATSMYRALPWRALST